ncbi:unnamed protein product [Cylindrotheca closterium]|uniref:Calcineurin-like phosphoesterase domain-containing protein n=1 Tax=Cylindrotheca closterium TaxID=2856 RepID=A0AAD2JM90_9STRA|nr:unnamed protein product [Cylindrotheca closterium]
MNYINSLLPSVSQTLSYLSGPAANENTNKHDGNTEEELEVSDSDRKGQEDGLPSSIHASTARNEETLECGSMVSSLEELEYGNAASDHTRKISIRKSTRNVVELMEYDSEDEVEETIVADHVGGKYDSTKRIKRTFLKQSRIPKQEQLKSTHVQMTGTVVSTTSKSRSEGKSSSQTDPSSDATMNSYRSDMSDEKCIQDLYSDFEKRSYRRHIKKVVMIFLSVLCVIIVITSVFVAIEVKKPEMDENTLLSNWGIGRSEDRDGQLESGVPSKQPSGFDGTSPHIEPIGDDDSDRETQVPSRSPTESLTDSPSGRPVQAATNSPTGFPSIQPVQSATAFPSTNPVESQTYSPSIQQVQSPTSSPSTNPVESQTESPSTQLVVEEDTLTATFYVIGDLPYNDRERTRLIEHVNNLPDDAEFLVHVGDIRDAESKTDCLLSEFDDVGDILKNSKVPVFIVPGDNEYNDCPNLSESWGDWKGVFGAFENNWSSSAIQPTRDPERPENFFFIHKRVLYIGLNIVGGEPHSYSEWEGRLSYQFTWTKNLIDTHVVSSTNDASSVVIFAHGDPRQSLHAGFFSPLEYYIANDLNNEVPIIYVNGDRHYFQFDEEWYGQESFHRIMVEGGSREPPLQMKLAVPKSADHGVLQVGDVCTFDRQL